MASNSSEVTNTRASDHPQIYRDIYAPRPEPERLYISFYTRGPQRRIKFHTGLTLAPPNPEPTLFQTWLYHIVNDKPNVWEYEVKETKNCTRKLVAVLLLRKFARGTVSGRDFAEALSELPIPESDNHWRCCHWTWQALQLLIDRGVLPMTYLSPREIWENGFRFAENSDSQDPFIPTCDIYGNQIESELRRRTDIE
ncbi:hypothetical protein JAAARDRAFT_37033 [Jaapia argillacea MUCL 33604]|uniref:Uncharacterized protein n=1 Tax=Jaapia argillacea MUCL 33604 TaxID=933084 RepID=A0A067PZ47_9AGAM|nr:hypothetical protein JAAARDRAFT_37033 [Jaapia argillacea MUCL 33604]